MVKRHIYIVHDIGRQPLAFLTRGAAKHHRLRATCGRCHPPQSCPHYAESLISKVGYSSDLKSVLLQEGAKLCLG